MTMQASVGQIIFLNGTSSSGKTSLAVALQQCLAGRPYMRVEVDTFAHMLPEGFLENAAPEARKPAAARLISGFHRAIAALASAGNHVIVDHVLPTPKWLQECAQLFSPYQVTFVGVHCPVEELERREAARGDRPPGLARSQFDLVHSHSAYDVEVDTSQASPAECAAQIQQYLENTTPQVFQQLRAALAPAGA